MMDIEKLIEQLNDHVQSYTVHDDPDLINALKNSATALSTLQAENEKLRVELQKSENDSVNLTGELAKVAAELEQVKRERDEAVQCIRGIAKSGRVWMCPYCVHAKDTTEGIAECELDVGVCMMPYSRFEWRDQKERIYNESLH